VGCILLRYIYVYLSNIQDGAEKQENLKSLEKHEGNFNTLFVPETVFYKSGNFIKTKQKKKSMV
jgi:hypothetical protein